MSTDLAVVDAAALAPVPTYSPEQMIEALQKYQALQRALDQAMPDAIITIADRQFRKKAYWRAIAVAFHVTVEPLEERREVQGAFDDGQPNFGWVCTYKATTPSGRASTGDGCCFSVEKAPRFRCPHPHPTRKGKTLHFPAEACPDFHPRHIWRTLPAQATEHNIRAHAHSRGYSRAISNCVGFAETPACELVDDDAADTRGARAAATLIDAAQQKRLFERWRQAGGTDEAALRMWFTRQGISDTSRISADDYSDVVVQLLIDRPGVVEPAPVDRDSRTHRALATRAPDLDEA